MQAPAITSATVTYHIGNFVLQAAHRVLAHQARRAQLGHLISLHNAAFACADLLALFSRSRKTKALTGQRTPKEDAVQAGDTLAHPALRFVQG